MARSDFPLSFNRRRLLTSAAATVTATGLLLGAKGADAVGLDFLQSSQLTLPAEPSNFCSATARRLVDIARRNELRREANLPLLSVAKELRWMNKQEELEEFTRFEAAYSKAMWDEVPEVSSGSRGQPKLATELDGGRRLSNPSEQDSLGTILGGTPKASPEFQRRRTKSPAALQNTLMAT